MVIRALHSLGFRDWARCEEKPLVRSSELILCFHSGSVSLSLCLPLSLSLSPEHEGKSTASVPAGSYLEREALAYMGGEWSQGNPRDRAGALTVPHLRTLYLSTFQLWCTNKPSLLCKPAWVRFPITCHRRSPEWFKCLPVYSELHPDALPWY